MYSCATCGRMACRDGDLETYPRTCPSRDSDRDELLAVYTHGEEGHLARNAAAVEGHGYGRLTRLEEIMDFARRCGFSRLGLAFCVGLQREAAVVGRVFAAHGFTVDSVACKNDALPKEELGLSDADKVRPGRFEPMCNPIGQGRALARAGTELNVILGLCVGHDSLFMRHSAAPVTVLAVKDRVLGHNPLAAVYLADGYYRARLFPPADDAGADP
jgi:uncharacterized metal-binding protein